MDLIDLVWNSHQESRIHEMREQVDQMQLDRDVSGFDLRDLAAENLELKLRLGLLVRLLIGKGFITAQEYAGLITEAQTKADVDHA